MKKTKKILSVILCVAALTSAFAFTACGGGNGGTQTEGGNQPEKEPVTTVANEEEWRNAFKKFFSSDNLTVECAMDTIMPGSSEVTPYLSTNYSLDYANDKFTVDFKVSADPSQPEYKNTQYYEINNDIVYKYNKESNSVWIPNYGGGIDEVLEQYDSNLSNAERNLINNALINNEVSVLKIFLTTEYYSEESNESKALLMDLYSSFTYVDGYYSSDKISLKNIETNLPVEVQVKVAIKDGVLSDIDLRYSDSTPDGSMTEIFTLKVENVNSTTVTTPEEARQAIDAEIAKGK